MPQATPHRGDRRAPHRDGLAADAAHHDACGVGFVASLHRERSRAIVDAGLDALEHLAHRGATGADPDSGDGAGVLLQLPDALLREACGFLLPPLGAYGVGTLFTADDDTVDEAGRALFAAACADEGLRVLGWRDVPVDASHIGPLARAAMPRIRQCAVAAVGLAGLDLERRLYVLRRVFEAHCAAAGLGRHLVHVPSLSSRTLVYKGMLTATQLRGFYPDLADERLASTFCMFHARFSTNVLPRWDLAQPLRMIAHNGEINTLRGNTNWMRARESKWRSPVFGGDVAKLRGVLDTDGSDSSQFDNALELLTMAGRGVEHAVLMMIPEAWHADTDMDPDLRAFYEFHASLLEPWDGPAAITFTDGVTVGATLDRNGLRPARYAITEDGWVVLASEAGALPLDEGRIVRKGRLSPGTLLLVDTEAGTLLDDGAVKRALAAAHPYRTWIDAEAVHLDALRGAADAPAVPDERELRAAHTRFGWTEEDLRVVLAPMATTGAEAVGSMGNDTAPAVLRDPPQLLFTYFKQLFAQVTNPPIDPIREARVMTLSATLGAGGNLLEQGPAQAHRLLLPHPVLTNEDMATLRHVTQQQFPTATLSATFPRADGPAGLARALERLCAAASVRVASGATVLIVSDRDAGGADVAIPSLLAVAAVHHHLVRAQTRTGVGLVVETGEAREVAHAAQLLAFGAEALNPYVAIDSIDALDRRGLLGARSIAESRATYVAALCAGLLKTIAKMGISALESYCGAQAFEALGIAGDVIERYFPATASRIGGVGLEEIAADAIARHDAAGATATHPVAPSSGGEYTWRAGGPHHLWNPDAITSLRRAVLDDDEVGFGAFVALADAETAGGGALRGALALRPHGAPLAIGDVEPVAAVLARFSTGGMSLGALSPEAHETLAVAMNRLGARSNSGEGGEDAERNRPDAHGDSRRSAIRQVASARFGVTAHYLVNADVLQIKIAQGAKPGEGGQLPGGKVDVHIATLRHSTPGVSLISPPPHHDVYSIEDLAQLIYDLRRVSPGARISVKLAAEVGVGTVAAGVAKAGADHVVVSGYEGGTGAAPLTSLKHVGVPWELGLAEAHQVLVANGLRDRVRLETDGLLRTGRDVVIAALLGADEFAFATAPLVALGCVLMRVCHLNTCPVGIATQDPRLRARFPGLPVHVERYFRWLAADVRRNLAVLGVPTLGELVGATHLLAERELDPSHPAAPLDLSGLLATPTPLVVPPGSRVHRAPTASDGGLLDDRLRLAGADALERGTPIVINDVATTRDRAVGAGLAGDVARAHGATGLPDDTVRAELRGSAGQSLGAWLPRGLTLRLAGEANDYVGKGLSGGRVVLRPSPLARFEAHDNVIAGNVCLYGATGGELFVRGVAGERFAVRNSGADAVVEGVGDHGCEYMTGGTVVVLGSIGRNFAAGMSGGTAYLYDPAGTAASKVNTELVDVDALDDEDVAVLRRLLSAHVRWTESERGAAMLRDLDAAEAPFVRVLPREFGEARRRRRGLALTTVA
ncbi:MAG TPA: glutamate synthase large subunit [Acidimicrobiales bacterium]|jgi:glutamate synthase domain-containing protein 2/glutamate synthase domain-containing protein 1/glutamate synthase domain-containing protein 3|nr:glutamate synthase large subunit [Acidimicrobiales bacterium]